MVLPPGRRRAQHRAAVNAASPSPSCSSHGSLWHWCLCHRAPAAPPAQQCPVPRSSLAGTWPGMLSQAQADPGAVKREHIEARGRCSDQRPSLTVPAGHCPKGQGGHPPDVTSAPLSSVSLCSCSAAQGSHRQLRVPSRAGGISRADGALEVIAEQWKTTLRCWCHSAQPAWPWQQSPLCQGQDPEASPKSHRWPCRAAPHSPGDIHVCNTPSGPPWCSCSQLPPLP